MHIMYVCVRINLGVGSNIAFDYYLRCPLERDFFLLYIEWSDSYFFVNE